MMDKEELGQLREWSRQRHMVPCMARAASVIADLMDDYETALKSAEDSQRKHMGKARELSQLQKQIQKRKAKKMSQGSKPDMSEKDIGYGAVAQGYETTETALGQPCLEEIRLMGEILRCIKQAIQTVWKVDETAAASRCARKGGPPEA